MEGNGNYSLVVWRRVSFPVFNRFQPVKPFIQNLLEEGGAFKIIKIVPNTIGYKRNFVTPTRSFLTVSK